MSYVRQSNSADDDDDDKTPLILDTANVEKLYDGDLLPDMWSFDFVSIFLSNTFFI